MSSLFPRSPHQSDRWMIPAQKAIHSSSNSLRSQVREQAWKAGRNDLLSILSEYCAPLETAEKWCEMTIIFSFFFFFSCVREFEILLETICHYENLGRCSEVFRWKACHIPPLLMPCHVLKWCLSCLKEKQLDEDCEYKCAELTMSYIKGMNNMMDSEQSTAS